MDSSVQLGSRRQGIRQILRRAKLKNDDEIFQFNKLSRLHDGEKIIFCKTDYLQSDFENIREKKNSNDVPDFKRVRPLTIPLLVFRNHHQFRVAGFVPEISLDIEMHFTRCLSLDYHVNSFAFKAQYSQNKLVNYGIFK